MKRLAEMTGPEVRALLNSVAKATRPLLPPGTAFVVVAFVGRSADRRIQSRVF
jgi:hypothetical protein